MRAAGQEHQERRGWCLVNQQIQQFEGRWVRPVQVFEDKEHRLALSVFQEDGDKGFEGFLSLSLRGYIERRVTIFRYRKRQQRGKKLYGFLHGQSILAEHLFEFTEFLVRGVLCVELQKPLE